MLTIKFQDSNKLYKLIVNSLSILFIYVSTMLLLLTVTQLTVSVFDVYPDSYQWVKEVWYIGKKTQVIYYMLAIVTTVLFFTAESLRKKNNNLSDEKLQLPVFIEALLFYTITFIIQLVCAHNIVQITDRTIIASKQVLWCVALAQVLFFVLGIYASHFFYKKNYNFLCSIAVSGINKFFNIFKIKFVKYALVAIGIGSYLAIYAPLLFSKIDFINEYLGIPSYYALESMKKICSGDSIDCINQIKPLGIQIRKYNENGITIARPHIEVTKDKVVAIQKLVKKNKKILYYDQFSKTLISISGLSSSIIDELHKIFPKATAKVEEFSKGTELREQVKKINLNKNQNTILNSSLFNLHWQILSRWYFHHHNFVWGPILNYVSNKGDDKGFFQYGKYSALAQYYLVKIFFGKFNISNYFSIWSMLFLSYLLIFAIIVYKITNSELLTISGIFFFVSFIFAQQYEYIFLGPGLNPIRHFFDLIALFYVYKYLSTNKSLFFYNSLIFSFIGFILNPEFGALLVISVSFVFVKDTSSKKKYNIINLVAFLLYLLLVIYLWFVLGKNKDDTIVNYLGGFFSPLATYGGLIKFLTLIFVLGYWSLLARDSKQPGFNLFFVGCLCYLLLLSIYPLFGMSWNHIANISSVIVFVFIMLVHFLTNCFVKYSQIINKTLVVVGFISLSATANLYFLSKLKYENTISIFKFYHWTINGERIRSQIDDKLFLDTKPMLEKYGITNSIYIFSRHENLAQIVLGISNSFNTHELATALYSTKDFQKYLTKIKSDSPQYILTDKTISSPHVDELIDSNVEKIGYLHVESKMRLERGGLIQEIFGRIKDDYKIIDESTLFILWQKKLR